MATYVFDVNETLSDLAPLADVFADLGLDRAAAQTWFARTLRDGFALTACRTPAPFAEIAAAVLRTTFASTPPDRPVAEAVASVLDAFTRLDVHSDVVEGMRSLQAHGHTLLTLSNGAASVADTLLTRAGIRDAFAQVLSVDGAGTWKPDSRAYAYAAVRTGTPSRELTLVAVHPWDVHGAQRAGLHGVWLDRTGAPWPEVFDPPQRTIRSLTELAG